MQLALLAVVAFALMGGGSKKQEPAPQQTVVPPTPPGQSTGQVVADVVDGVGKLVDMFKAFMDGVNSQK